MTDNRIYRTRSLGIPAAGVKDQYADGVAAHLWELYIGDKSQRTSVYRKFITDQLRSRNCKTVLDVACGTGIDSVMLLEEGFELTSTDLSDKMLKYALKTRWQRRKEAAFDNWVIEEANWMTLPEDVGESECFDAVICLGNSFAHLPDEEGGNASHKIALQNFAEMVKPGGILIIDHRNYDYIIKNGRAPTHNIYYNSVHVQSIITSLVVTEGVPKLITLDYVMAVEDDGAAKILPKEGESTPKKSSNLTQKKFRLSYYPHEVDKFTGLLSESFGPGSKQSVFGDFKPIGEAQDPAFFIHVVEKSK